MTVANRPPSSPVASEPLLIDAKAAAALLGVSARTLWGLTTSDAVPARRIGRRVLYAPTELRAWIACDCPTDPGSADRVRKAMGNGGGR